LNNTVDSLYGNGIIYFAGAFSPLRATHVRNIQAQYDATYHTHT